MKLESKFGIAITLTITSMMLLVVGIESNHETQILVKPYVNDLPLTTDVVVFSTDGTKLFLLDFFDNTKIETDKTGDITFNAEIREYHLDTPWDLFGNVQFNDSLYVYTLSDKLNFENNGTLIILDDDKLFCKSWDISTCNSARLMQRYDQFAQQNFTEVGMK